MAPKRRLPWWIAPVVAILLIFCFSSGVIFEGEFTQTVGTWIPIPDGEAKFRAFWKQTWWFWTKGFHVLEFAVLTWLAHTALHNGAKHPFKKSLLLAALIALTYACLDEYHQTYIPGRGGRPEDVLIDCMGITAACITNTLKKRRADTQIGP